MFKKAWNIFEDIIYWPFEKTWQLLCDVVLGPEEDYEYTSTTQPVIYNER